MKKKLLCLVLSLAMMAVFMPTMAFADSEVNVVEVATFNQLADAVKAHTSNDVITLTQDITAEETLYVSDDTTIDLHKHTITGLNRQVFSVYATASLQLENGTVKGGAADNGYVDGDRKSGNGGAVFVGPNADLYLTNMVLTGNAANFNGGAVDLNGDLYLAGVVKIYNNTVGLQNAKKGNVYVEEDGMIYDEGLATGSVVGVDAAQDKAFAQVAKSSINYFVADNSLYGVAYAYKESHYELTLLQAKAAAENNALPELAALAAKAVKYQEKANAIVTDATSAMEKASTVAEVKAIAAKAKQQLNALLAKEKQEAAALAAKDALGNAIDRIEGAAFVTGRIAYNTALATSEKVKETLEAIQDRVEDSKKAAQEALGNLFGFTAEVTGKTASVVAGMTQMLVIEPYQEALEKVQEYAGAEEVTAVSTIAKNALEQIKKYPEASNYVAKTNILRTALQQINLQKLAEKTAVVTGQVGFKALIGLHEFLDRVFAEPGASTSELHSN